MDGFLKVLGVINFDNFKVRLISDVILPDISLFYIVTIFLTRVSRC